MLVPPLPPGTAERTPWWVFTHAVRVATGPLTPARIRFWDHYRVAVARCQAEPTR